MSKQTDLEVTKTKDKKRVEEWYEKMNRQFEEDSKTGDYTLSKEWDEAFLKAMFGEYDIAKRKRRKRKAYIAAGIAAMALAGVGVSQKEVIGDGLEKIFNNQSDAIDSEMEHFGTKEEISVGKNEYEEMFSYDGKTLTDVYKQVRAVLKRPFFMIQDNFGNYEIREVYYGTDFDVVMIQLKTEEGSLFISQREVLDNGSTGVKNDNTSIIVWNEHLQQNIVLNRSVQDQSYTFSIKRDSVIFNFNGYVSKEMCIKIAEDLLFE